METTLNYEHYRRLMSGLLQQEKYQNVEVARLHPLVLAYIGDAYFTLFVRTRLLGFEQNKVRILHDYDAKIVSAVMQAQAAYCLESVWTEEEKAIFKRGRNAKSTVPKSATVVEYRNSTGFEAVLGYLYLTEKFERLADIAEQAFVIISRKLTDNNEFYGGKK